MATEEDKSTIDTKRLEAYNEVVARSAGVGHAATPRFALPNLIAITIFGAVIVRYWKDPSDKAAVIITVVGLAALVLVGLTIALSYRHAKHLRARANRDASMASALAFIDDGRALFAACVEKDLGIDAPTVQSYADRLKQLTAAGDTVTEASKALAASAQELGRLVPLLTAATAATASVVQASQPTSPPAKQPPAP